MHLSGDHREIHQQLPKGPYHFLGRRRSWPARAGLLLAVRLALGRQRPGHCGRYNLPRFIGSNQRSRDVVDKPWLRFITGCVVEDIRQELGLREGFEAWTRVVSVQVSQRSRSFNTHTLSLSLELPRTFIAIHRVLLHDHSASIDRRHLFRFPAAVTNTGIVLPAGMSLRKRNP